MSEVCKIATNEEQSTRVTPDVSICVLRYPCQTSSFYPHISAIDKAHPIALLGIEICQGAPESHMIRARSICRMTRFETR